MQPDWRVAQALHGLNLYLAAPSFRIVMVHVVCPAHSVRGPDLHCYSRRKMPRSVER